MSERSGGASGPLDALLEGALAPLGRAIRAYAAGEPDATLLVHVEDLSPEPLPAAYFFREPSAMGEVDGTALAFARGRVLDVGACAGAHAVPLTQAGLPVTALELVPEAVRILRERGVADARRTSLWSFRDDSPYDTILALMNGTALAGTAGGLEPLLTRLSELVAPGGQLLMDSTDLDPEEGMVELHYQLEFAGERGPPFPQLFAGPTALERSALATGWQLEVVAEEGPRYLARLVRPPTHDPGTGGMGKLL